MKKASLLVCSLVVSACAVQKYPITGPTVDIEVVAPKFQKDGFDLIARSAVVEFSSSDSGCPFSSTGGYRDDARFYDAKNLSTGNSTASLKLPSDTTVFAKITDIASGVGCVQSIRFKTKYGKKYKISVNTQGNIEEAVCNSIIEIDSVAANLSTDEVFYAPQKTPFGKWTDYKESCIGN